MTKTKPRAVGRPQRSVAECMPENWKELITEWSDLGWTEAEIRVGLCKVGGKFKHDLWYALKARDQEFSDTLQSCKALRQAWWEKQARENLKSGSFQTGLWYACMKNMFGYRDKHEVEHSGGYEVKVIHTEVEERITCLQSLN